MSGIRSGHTRPEMLVRRALHARGLRYRLHSPDIPGRPDIVLTRHRAVIFVHGCFWHGHDCALFRMPGTRREFWQAKIDRNRARDREVHDELRRLSWRQANVWECALRGPDRIGLEIAIERIVAWLADRQQETLTVRGHHRTEGIN